MTKTPTGPMMSPTTGPAPEPVVHLAPLVRELGRLRGRERGLIRQQAERFVGAVWETRTTDARRREALVWALERLLFDVARD